MLGNLVVNHGELEDTDQMILVETVPWQADGHPRRQVWEGDQQCSVLTRSTRTFQRGSPVGHTPGPENMNETKRKRSVLTTRMRNSPKNCAKKKNVQEMKGVNAVQLRQGE